MKKGMTSLCTLILLITFIITDEIVREKCTKEGQVDLRCVRYR